MQEPEAAGEQPTRLLGRLAWGRHEPCHRCNAGREDNEGTPGSNLAWGLGKTNIRVWAEESVYNCLSTVYKNLDPNITRFFDRPFG